MDQDVGIKERAREPTEYAGMHRYRSLIKLLGSKHDTSTVFEIASHYDYEEKRRNRVTQWNEPTSYRNVLGALLSFLPLTEEQYASLTASAQSYRAERQNETEKGYEQKFATEKGVRKLLARAILEQRVFEGIAVAEIGGTVLDQLLTPLGATVHYQDADLGWFDMPNEKRLVTLANYHQVFPQQYDFTVTNWVFGSGAEQSGVSDIHDGLEGATMKGVFTEMFALLWNLTKPGGYSIHAAVDTDHISPTALTQMGFEIVYASYNGNIAEPSYFERRDTGEIVRACDLRPQKETEVWDMREVLSSYRTLRDLLGSVYKDFDSFWEKHYPNYVDLLILKKQTTPTFETNWGYVFGQDPKTWDRKVLRFNQVNRRYTITTVSPQEWIARWESRRPWKGGMTGEAREREE